MFHALALALFAPSLVLQRELTALGLAVATALLALAEITRALRVPVFSPPVDAYFSQFVDRRDAGWAIVSHLYLLVGCAAPVWLAPASDDFVPAQAAFAGVVALGVGDAVAAVVGTAAKRAGTAVLWPGSEKTVQGTASAAASMLVAVAWTRLFLADVGAPAGAALQPVVLVGAGARNGGSRALLTPGLAAATGAVALLETFTDQLDNVVLPLYAFAVFTLAGGL
jgi:dolichol kinase